MLFESFQFIRIASCERSVWRRFVGADGTPDGTTGVALFAVDEPSALVADTLNVYEIPFVRPVTVQVSAVAGLGEQVPPGAPLMT